MPSGDTSCQTVPQSLTLEQQNMVRLLNDRKAACSGPHMLEALGQLIEATQGMVDTEIDDRARARGSLAGVVGVLATCFVAVVSTVEGAALLTTYLPQAGGMGLAGAAAVGAGVLYAGLRKAVPWLRDDTVKKHRARLKEANAPYINALEQCRVDVSMELGYERLLAEIRVKNRPPSSGVGAGKAGPSFGAVAGLAEAKQEDNCTVYRTSPGMWKHKRRS